MAGKLLAKLEEIEAEFETTLQEDDEWQAAGGLSAWEEVAVAYRRERKLLAVAAGAILRTYISLV
jgi:hypothetical protein